MNFQRNLFVVLAIALCAVCAYQWYLQAAQTQAIQVRNQEIYDQSAKIQDYTNSIHTMETEVNQLHDRIGQLKQTISSNEQWAITEKREVARLLSDNDLMTNEIVQYKAAVEKFTGQLKEAYDAEKKLAAQRDEFVEKLNNNIKSQNDLVKKYNDLVDRFNKLQTNAAAQSK